MSVFLCLARSRGNDVVDGKRNEDRRDDTGHGAEKRDILKTERHEESRARGDTERCSPFAARGEATHVARRSFVIRQIAFLPGRVTPEESSTCVDNVGRTRVRTYARVPGVASRGGRIRARKIIIILTGRAARDPYRPYFSAPHRNTSSFLAINFDAPPSFELSVESTVFELHLELS